MEFDGNTLLAVSFGLWAGVVGLGTRAVLKRLDGLSQKVGAEGEKFNRYIIQTEARLAVLERVGNIGNGKGKSP